METVTTETDTVTETEMVRVNRSLLTKLFHLAGTSNESDICDLSINSDITPLTLGSMANTTYFVSIRKPI